MLGRKITQGIASLFGAKEKDLPITLKRRNHTLSRKKVSAYALKVLYRLRKGGFAAYLVGGSVRDILLNGKPKDFDVSTDARPEQIRKLFRNSRIIGRRFLLVHVYYPGEIIEVSTFRASSEEMFVHEEHQLTGVLQEENIYGTIEEDAWRRDFTINALYYNIEDFSVVDFTGGISDLKKRLVRMIGDPVQRYREDPVRLLRAIRLSAKLNFNIEANTEAPIRELMGLLRHVPISRLYDELLKLFFKGHALKSYQKLDDYGFLEIIFPQTAAALKLPSRQTDKKLIELTLKSIDDRFTQDQSLNPGFLFAALLWPALQMLINQDQHSDKIRYQTMHHSIDQLLHDQRQLIALSKRLAVMMRSIWTLQYHLIRRRPSRTYRLVNHRYFRAALDFLELRAEAGESLQELATWWRAFQHSSHQERERMIRGMKGWDEGMRG